MGVFQIESRAQMSMLPRLQPKYFYDLVIEVAIVRPGPIQGDMVHPYLRRRAARKPVNYPNERIRAVLEKTLGVPLFQEQAMRLAVVAAGFTPGEADQLRRAMGAWRRPGVIDHFRQKLLDGMAANGYSDEFAERVFKQIRGFGEYGFPESHAASFALLVYVSAWLKCHYPAAFAAALLNSQPMGFYAPAQLVAQRPASMASKCGRSTSITATGIARWKRPPVGKEDESEVTSPGWHWRLPASGTCAGRLTCGTPDLGLWTAVAARVADGERLVASACRSNCRPAGRSSVRFVRGLCPPHAIEQRRLVEAVEGGRLRLADGWSADDALWNSLPVQKSDAPVRRLRPHPGPLPDGRAEEPPVALPAASPLSEVVADYRATGLSLRDHPMKFLRPTLEKLRVAKASDLAILPVDRRVKVAGLTLMRQRPGTASGITFVTLEDETGFANLIVRPEVWERYHQAARTATALLAHGRLQRQENVIHVLVTRLDDLSKRIADLGVSSRDFH